MAGIGVCEVEAGAAELIELGRGQRADRALRVCSGTILELIVEDALAGTYRPFAVAFGIPRQPNAPDRLHTG